MVCHKDTTRCDLCKTNSRVEKLTCDYSGCKMSVCLRCDSYRIRNPESDQDSDKDQTQDYVWTFHCDKHKSHCGMCEMSYPTMYRTNIISPKYQQAHNFHYDVTCCKNCYKKTHQNMRVLLMYSRRLGKRLPRDLCLFIFGWVF
jgi:hypothetical protein